MEAIAALVNLINNRFGEDEVMLAMYGSGMGRDIAIGTACLVPAGIV